MKPTAYPTTNSADAVSAPLVLLSIGCNKYENGPPLDSAEADAKAIFEALTSGPASLYNNDDSVLLLSPSRADIERSISKLLARREEFEVIAIYFAGHGIMLDGSFYICPSDTSLTAISISAINISTILRALCELKPRHAYLIIDACHSGGASLDLGAVLKADILAQSPGFGVTVLSSAKITRAALEVPSGGLFTLELLKVLDGRRVINDSSPFLGLGDVVRKVLEGQSVDLENQAPNFWDLNLTGPDVFCRNPAYAAHGHIHSAEFGTLRISQSRMVFSQELANDVWRAFLELPCYNFDNLCSLFDRAVLTYKEAGSAVPADAIVRSFVDGVRAHGDTFATVQVRLAMVRALMPHIGDNADARQAIRAQIGWLVEDAFQALAQVELDLSSNRYCLLSERSGYSDLYYLPLRLSRVLGWIGFVLIAQERGLAPSADLDLLKHLTDRLLEYYGNSIVCVGDDQAPFILTFLAGCKAVDWSDPAEEVVGRLYLDFNENFGRVLCNSPQASDIANFLQIKSMKPFTCEEAFLQNPSELFSVILLGACLFDLDEEIDYSLVQLDRASFSFYVPRTFSDFWREHIQDGASDVYRLGHGVWSINDVRRVWNNDVLSFVREAVVDVSDEAWIGACLMAFAFPDRLPLFLVPEMRFRAAWVS